MISLDPIKTGTQKMSLFVENEPTTIPPVPPPSLGEAACDILFALDTLTLFDPPKPIEAFNIPVEHDEYINNRRFLRMSTKIPSQGSGRWLGIRALHLLSQKDVEWTLNAHRTDDKPGLDGCFAPDAPDTAYRLEFKSYQRQGDDLVGPTKDVTVDFRRDTGASEPAIRYFDRSMGLHETVIVNPEEPDDSVYVDVVKAVASELKREAAALTDFHLEALTTPKTNN